MSLQRELVGNNRQPFVLTAMYGRIQVGRAVFLSAYSLQLYTNKQTSGLADSQSLVLNISMAATGLPITLYEDLLPKLVAVLESTEQTVGISTPQAKQKLLQTVCNGKYNFMSRKLTRKIIDQGL